MKVSTRAKYLLLMGLILINIGIRIPSAGRFHEHGHDSFYLHAMASSIKDDGYGEFIANPLSLFGMYPFSYPALTSLIVSTLSDLSGLSVEVTIFLVSLMCGFLGMAAGFLLGGEIRESFLFRYAMAFFISTSPVFVFDSLWTMPKRALFLAFFTFLIFLLLKYRHSKYRKRYLAMIGMTCLILASLHRMFLLLPLILIAYGITLLMFRFLRSHVIIVHPENVMKTKGILIVAWLCVIGVLLYLQANRIWIYSSSESLYQYYTSGFFFKGDTADVLIFNLLVDYVSSIGIISFAIFPGIIAWVKWHTIDAHIFMLLAILTCAVILMLGTYMVFLFLPPVIVLSTHGIFSSIHLRRMRRLSHLFLHMILTTLLISASFTVFMVEHWSHHRLSEGTNYWIRDETISCGYYIRYNLNDHNVLTNDHTLSRRLMPYMSRFAFPSIDLAFSLYGAVDVNEIVVRPISISDISPSLNYFYLPKSKDPAQEIWRIYGRDVDNRLNRKVYERYDFKYLVLNNNQLFVTQYGHYRHHSVLTSSAYQSKVMVFTNNLESVLCLT